MFGVHAIDVFVEPHDPIILDPHDDLARARRRSTAERLRGQLQALCGLRSFDPVGEQPFEPGFVLVHLAELAMAPIALDQLSLAGDLVCLRLDVLDGPGVALLALAAPFAVGILVSRGYGVAAFGVALVCDSTNVFTEGTSGSEADVRDQLTDLIGKYPAERVVVACFASNVARPT